MYYRIKMNPEKLKQLQAKADQVRIGGKVSLLPVLWTNSDTRQKRKTEMKFKKTNTQKVKK